MYSDDNIVKHFVEGNIILNIHNYLAPTLCFCSLAEGNIFLSEIKRSLKVKSCSPCDGNLTNKNMTKLKADRPNPRHATVIPMKI